MSKEWAEYIEFLENVKIKGEKIKDRRARKGWPALKKGSTNV